MYGNVKRGGLKHVDQRSLKDVQAAAEKEREEFSGHAPHAAAAAAAAAAREAKEREAKQEAKEASWTENPLTTAESIV